MSMPGFDDTPAYAAAREAQRKALRRRRRPVREPPSALPDAAPRRSPSQRRGDRAEAAALALLRRAGLVLLARNLACRAGELDLVMREGDVLVFVEVRSRGSARYGGAAASVGHAKQQRLRRAAQRFLPELARRHWGAALPRCRFDVVAEEAGGLRWLPGAFGQD